MTDLPAIFGNDAVLSAVTPGGLPYPVSGDPANQGANAIKALALALDATYAETSAANGSVANSTWMAAPLVNMLAVAGPNLSLVGGGLKFAAAGRYLVEARVAYPANTVGRRGIGAGKSATVTPSAQLSNPLASGSTLCAYIFTVNMLVNESLFLWVYQESGAVMTFSQAYLNASKL